MICLQCQTANADSARFCRSCGSQLQQVCRHCGSVLTAQDRFCTACGRPVTIEQSNTNLTFHDNVSQSSEPLTKHLTALEAADLIRLSQVEPNLEYLFRHALVQDAAYESLLRSDRLRLHLSVGRILERLYPERLEELAPVLGHHFYEAGSSSEARKYFTLAGDCARRRYANAEAVAHYSRAIEVAETEDLSVIALYRARGLTHETTGEFDQARADYDAALRIGRNTVDRRSEWQALLDLGMLWAARDYEQSQTYLHNAFELAHQLDDPATVAYSLNRIGNWHVNHDEPVEGQRFHREALEIFQQLGDRQGIADTFDLLGMASILSGNVANGITYYQQAIKLLEELGNQLALTSSLVGLVLPISGNSQTDLMVSREIDFETMIKYAERSVSISREIGYRAGEAFALAPIAWGWSSHGEMMRGLELARRAYGIAEDIQHRQWMTLTRWTLGIIYLDYCALSEAEEQFEKAYQLALEIRSRHWISCSGGLLANVYTRQSKFAEAKQLLDAQMTPTLRAQSIGQRFLWSARAELYLAQGDTENGMRVLDYIVHDTVDLDERGEGAILRIALLRGRTLTRIIASKQDSSQETWTRAEKILRTGQSIAYSIGGVTQLWQFQAALGQLYLALDRRADAEKEFAATQTIVNRLALKIDDDYLRRKFLDRTATVLQH